MLNPAIVHIEDNQEISCLVRELLAEGYAFRGCDVLSFSNIEDFQKWQNEKNRRVLLYITDGFFPKTRNGKIEELWHEVIESVLKSTSGLGKVLLLSGTLPSLERLRRYSQCEVYVADKDILQTPDKFLEMLKCYTTR